MSIPTFFLFFRKSARQREGVHRMLLRASTAALFLLPMGALLDQTGRAQTGAQSGPQTSAQPDAQPAPADTSVKAPRLVIIVRHAEKPPKEEHSPDINETGQLRAKKLPTLFLAAPGPSGTQPPRLPRPQFIFATSASKSSNRPAETCAPTAYELNEKLNLDFGDKDEYPLAKDLLSGKYAGKVVFVCWHHGAIPMLAKALGVFDPPHWKDETFDQIWEIDWNDGTAHLTTAPEMLLPGDSTR